VAARARRILAEVDGVRGEVDELQGLVRGQISIGALLPAGEIDVPLMLARFSEAYPGIEVTMREGTAGEMAAYLVEDEVDVAFSMLADDPAEGVVAEYMSEEEIVAVFPPGRAPRGRVKAAYLSPSAIATPRQGSAIKTAVDRFFADAGEPLHVSIESGDPFLLRCLVSGGFGPAVLPRSLTRREGPPIEVRSFNPIIRLPVALLWREHRHASPVARAFIDFARREASR
jgi:LysR family transcriptional activator of glutamate synthase operon